MKVKRILVSQPKPSTEKSPYFDLAKKYKLTIDFRPFIHVEGVSSVEFRKSKIKIEDHTAVILSSKTAIDNFFRLVDELRVTVPDTMKYFCISEVAALYLQKYITYRKRKIFFGTGQFPSVIELMQKHKSEKFLFPLSDAHTNNMTGALDKNKINYTKAIMYRTVNSDLSDLKDINYDILVFFSPSGIKSLLSNFPDFEQNKTVIATFGPVTARTVKEAGLRLDIDAPNAKAPSMPRALENYIKSL